MAQVGTVVSASSVAAATTTPNFTGNLFLVGLSDWGPVGQPVTITSLGNAASQIGTPAGSGNPYSSRTSTCATVFDACDTYFHEDAPQSPGTIYFSRVVHGSTVAATLVLNDGSANAALSFTAQYVGAGGNGIYIACTNATSTYTLTLTDVNGYTLAASPSLSTLAAGVAWAATTGYVTAVAGTHGLPATSSATAMSGGTDNRGSVAIADVTTALNALSTNLGPGQVIAPNWTNTTLSGVWSALGTHAINYNRYAICDMDDNTSASTAVAAVSSITSATTASYIGFWAGNRNIPGIPSSPGTTRSIAPSSAVAGLMARVDAQTGNPNRAAAGVLFPLVYATAPTSLVSGAPNDTYSLSDLYTLNTTGINTFHYQGNQPCNYGFVSAILSTADGVYWQANHGRLRMAIIAAAQAIGQPFVFSQIDGQGSQTTAFGAALGAMLQNFWKQGALYGATAQQAYVVDTGPDVNTPATIAAGQLNASITCAFSPMAQQVNININVVPITTQIP